MNGPKLKIFYDMNSGEIQRRIKIIEKNCVNLPELKLVYLQNKQYTKRSKIKFLGKIRIVNIHNKNIDLEHFNKKLSNHRISRNISYLKSIIDFKQYNSHYVKINQFFPYSVTISHLKTKQIKKKNNKRLKFRIAKLYFYYSKSPVQISKILNVNQAKVKSILCHLRYSNNSLNDMLKTKEDNSEDILIKNYLDILNLYDNDGICYKSMKEQLEVLTINKQVFQNVSLKQYTNFCKTNFKTKYKLFKRMGINYDSEIILDKRYMISQILLQIIRKKYHLLFFDETTLCGSNYSNKAWTINSSKTNTFSSLKKIVQRSNALMICSMNNIVNFWITPSINKEYIMSFLVESIKKYKSQHNTKKLIIFWDNAKTHHGKEMRQISKYLSVYFIFNIPYSCKINMIELVFELIKRKIRTNIKKEPNKNMNKIFYQEIKNIINFDLEHQRMQWLKEIGKCTNKIPMWK